MNKYNNKKWLKEKYLEKRLNAREIAFLCGSIPRTVHSWLVKFGIPRRHGGWQKMPEEQKEIRRRWNKNHPEINRMKGKHHSIETRKKMSKDREGPGNANWKGGITAKIRAIRRSKEYRQWRNAIKKRDNYKCAKCGTTEKLSAHHIESVFQHPEKIFETSNGITLCEVCHIRTYRKKPCKKQP